MPVDAYQALRDALRMSARKVVWMSLAVVLCVACNKKLHANTQVLLDALANGDYAAVKAIAGPKLLEEMEEHRFMQMSATYQMLGPLKDKTRTATGTQNGTQYIQYKLTFESGKTLELRVVSTSKGALDGFHIEGETWEEAMTALLEDRATKFADAFAANDRAAFPKLFTDNLMKDVESRGGFTGVDVGKRTKIELLERAEEKLSATYRVTFEKGTVKLRVGLRGGKISSFDIEPL